MKKFKMIAVSSLALVLLVGCNQAQDTTTNGVDDAANNTTTNTTVTDNAADDEVLQTEMDPTDPTADVAPGEAVDPNATTPGDSSEVTDDNAGLDRNSDISSLNTNYQDPKEAFERDFADAQIEEIELDYRNGRHVYKVEGFNTTQERELILDAQTLEVINDDIDNDNDDNDDAIDFTNILDLSEVVDANLAQMGEGAYLTSWKLDEDDGRYIYELDIRRDNQTQELKVDATTGEVLELDD